MSTTNSDYSADLYSVDWSDESYPRIVRGGNLTFTEAKGEILGHYTYLRDFAKRQIAATRAMRTVDTGE